MKKQLHKVIIWPIVIILLLLAFNSFADDPNTAFENGQLVSADVFFLEMVGRPENYEIKDTTEQVLKRPEFKEVAKSGFLNKIDRWFSSVFDGIDVPGNSGVINFIVKLVVIWCVITLLAILAHFIWALYVTFSSSGIGSRTAKFDESFAESTYKMTVEDLLAEMEKCLEAKDYAGALSYLTVSLLKRVDSFGFIKLHPSKTNGDYLRECGRSNGIFNVFRQYLIGFESVAYGFKSCDETYFQRMFSVYEKVEQECKQAEEC